MNKEIFFTLSIVFSVPSLASFCELGDIRSGYISPIVHGFEQCIEEVQSCSGGMWNGPELYMTCDNPTEPCGEVLHGSVEFGYTSPFEPCIEEERICLDGEWSKPPLFSSCD